ncbi:MAG: sigma-70 family RNA polymerase sigma factor [Verrucomicrobia bacterium]|nr:sigma-70 family RNA polymerase sigma factor [Verrucomicrobiota bacterium]
MPPPLDDPDAALMLRYRDGDESAFDALVEKFKSPVFNYVCRQVNNMDDAEDIAQNVFVQVYKSAERYEPTARFTTWLFTIARNLCLNEFRRRDRHPLQSLEETVTDDPASAPTQIADPRARSPAIEVSEKELQGRVLAAIQKLPENQRTAVLLCRYDGMAYEEIAQVLNTSVSATKSLLHRARETLRNELREFLTET